MVIRTEEIKNEEGEDQGMEGGCECRSYLFTSLLDPAWKHHYVSIP